MPVQPAQPPSELAPSERAERAGELDRGERHPEARSVAVALSFRCLRYTSVKSATMALISEDVMQRQAALGASGQHTRLLPVVMGEAGDG